LFKEVRELILRRCAPGKEKQIRAIFEKQPFGELERLVTQKLLDVVKRVAKDELESETWLHSVARLSGRSYEALRVSILEFLDADAFSVSVESCAIWDLSLSRSLQAGPLRQQSQSLLVIHVLPRDKFLGKHIHSVKEGQL
jgi:hypothetical protein